MTVLHLLLLAGREGIDAALTANPLDLLLWQTP
jgi:hypothetical protein